MIPCGTSKAGTLASTSHAAELPVGDSEGICERPRSMAEDDGHLFGLSRDDLPKSMSDSSISSYHSALCSEGTETFGDCLEFLEEEEEAPAAQPPLEEQGSPMGAEGPPGRAGASAERWAPGSSTASPGGAPSGAGAVGSRPQEERTQQVQLSVTAKNSAAVGHGGRMGPGRGERPPAASDSSDQPPPFNAEAPALMLCATHKAKKGGRVAGAGKAVCAPRGALSDSDEADNEVQKLTARSFRSLSGPHGGYLDMYSSHTSSSLSNSLSEDGGAVKRWPTGSEPRGAALALHARPARPFLGVGPALDKEFAGSMPGKEQFECVDVELESNDAKKGHCKKRTVPKRQIQLKRKERKEAGFFPWGDCSAHQPLPPPRKEPLTKGRAISDEFRINYKQFMRTASLDDTCNKTRMASCLVKNVLAKKMQYEQRIKMEQKALQGSSTSSGPSSVGTDLAGDCLEGKSSSLSKSDCSYSAEDVHVGSQRPVPVATRPTKGVVLNEETRENVCKLKTTFNELNERIKYQEVMQCQALLAEQARSRRREDYRRARAMFEQPQDDGKAPDAPPKFEKPQKPWPSLRQRAIRPSKPEAIPFKPKALGIPVAATRSVFTSRTQEVKLVPQSQQEEKAPPEGGSVGRAATGAPREAPPVPRRPPVTRPLERTPQPGNKGKGQIPQPRDVRKLVKNTYSLCFKPAGAAAPPAPGTGTGGGSVGSPTGAPAAASPLFIHCTSVCRKEPVPLMSRARQKSPQQAEDGAVLAVPSCEAREARTAGPTKPPERQRSAARDSPMSITKIQSTRRVAGGQEGPAGRSAEPAVRHERSELTLPPVARAAPHMESHLHVRVSPLSTQAPSPAQRGPCHDGPLAPAAPAAVASSAVLLTEKTVLFPPPASAAGEATGQHHAAASARAPNPPSQQPSSSEGFLGPPGARGVPELAPPAGVNPRPQATQPAGAAASGPKPLVNEHLLSSTGPRETERERPDAVKPPGGWVAAAGSSMSLDGMGASPVFQTREATEEAAVPQGPSAAPAPLAGRLPDRRENWEHLTKQTGANEQYFTATPMENTNYLTIPVKAPKSSPAPNLPSGVSPASAAFGTSLVPNQASTPFGHPSASSPASTSFGTTMFPNTACTSFGTPLVPNRASTSFGHPSASSLASTSFGTPLVPNTASTSFRTPLVPNRASTSFGHPSASSLASTSFGSPLVPNTASTSFGTPLVPTRASTSFGYPSASSLASTSFGSPLVPNPSSISFGYPPASKPTSTSFGSPVVLNPSSTSFGAPLVPNLPSTSFGAPLATNPGPASLRHPSVSNPANSSPGSPLVPKAASSPSMGGEAPWSHPSPELPLPPASEGQAAAEQLGAQPQLRLEDAAHFLRRTDGASPSSKSTPSPTRPFAPHQHRKMLLDPDSGKCYYMEPPRQPQLKTLYDPETGQYLEVLIPPVPLASHAGLYQAPLVMTPGVYGPPYMPYAGFSGLAAPATASPVHADPQGQAPAAENASFGAAFSPTPKGEGPAGAAGPDGSYLDSLYYIPTGMRASPGPGPGPGAGQPAASGSPDAPEKAPLLRM